MNAGDPCKIHPSFAMKKVVGRHHPPSSCPQHVQAIHVHRPAAKPGYGMEIFIAIGLAIVGIAGFALWEHSKTIVELPPEPPPTEAKVSTASVEAAPAKPAERKRAATEAAEPGAPQEVSK